MVGRRGKASPRVFASPLARRIASQGDVQLTLIQGSGPHGRIVKSDVDAACGGVNVAKLLRAASPRNDPAGLRARDGAVQRHRQCRTRAFYPKGQLRRSPARLDAQDDRETSHDVEARHPALLPEGRLHDRHAARRAQADERQGPDRRRRASTNSRSTTSSSRRPPSRSSASRASTPAGPKPRSSNTKAPTSASRSRSSSASSRRSSSKPKQKASPPSRAKPKTSPPAPKPKN